MFSRLLSVFLVVCCSAATSTLAFAAAPLRKEMLLSVKTFLSPSDRLRFRSDGYIAHKKRSAEKAVEDLARTAKKDDKAVDTAFLGRLADAVQALVELALAGMNYDDYMERTMTTLLGLSTGEYSIQFQRTAQKALQKLCREGRRAKVIAALLRLLRTPVTAGNPLARESVIMLLVHLIAGNTELIDIDAVHHRAERSRLWRSLDQLALPQDMTCPICYTGPPPPFHARHPILGRRVEIIADLISALRSPLADRDSGERDCIISYVVGKILSDSRWRDGIISFVGNLEQPTTHEKAELMRALDQLVPPEGTQDLACSICRAAPRAFAFAGCGHLSFCEKCEPSTTRCPICRTTEGGKRRTRLFYWATSEGERPF